MRTLTFALLSGLLIGSHAVASTESWTQLKHEASGQTVWFNAWGGDPAVNRYLEWVRAEVGRHYAIDLRIVHLADAADAVRRIGTEVQAGRTHNGSIDLLDRKSVV